jgi:hypothetical protein
MMREVEDGVDKMKREFQEKENEMNNRDLANKQQHEKRSQ